MSSHFNPARHTISDNPTTVPVAEFRSRIDHAVRVVRVDRPACVGAGEVARWVEIAKAVGDAVIDSTCVRATADDWARREAAIDASTTAIFAATEG